MQRRAKQNPYCRKWYDALLSLEINDPRARDEVDRAARANCLIDIATLLVMRGAAAAARPFFDDAAELAQELDDPKLFAMARSGPRQAVSSISWSAKKYRS